MGSHLKVLCAGVCGLPLQMHDAQQYMFHRGHPALLQWARDLAARCHATPGAVDVVITSGAVSRPWGGAWPLLCMSTWESFKSSYVTMMLWYSRERARCLLVHPA